MVDKVCIIILMHAYFIQMDLIDYGGNRTRSGDLRYILHLRDHRTKYSWAYALPSKRAADVGEKLHDLFCQVGPPKELQSDNGGEFTAIDMVSIEWLKH